MNDLVRNDGVPASFGQTVNLIKPKAGNFEASQPSAALNPAYGRVPASGRRNLLNNSVDLSRSPWNLTNVTATLADNVTPPKGIDTVFSVTEDTSDSLHRFGLSSFPIINGTGTFYLKPNGRRYLLFGNTGYVLDNSSYSVVDIEAATVIYDRGQSITVTRANDGWVEFSASGSWEGGYTSWFLVFLNSDTPRKYSQSSYLGDGVSGVYFAGLQIEKGDTPTPYQRALSNLDVYEEGQPHTEFLRFDHVDDCMFHTFPDGFQGDLIACGTEGSWVDESVIVPSGGQLTVGPKSLPGTPNILPALGDIIGWVSVSRTTTEKERQAVIDYYKSKGAKGKLVDGSELIVNGGFDSSDDWSLQEMFEITGGALRVPVKGQTGHATQYLDLTKDKVYRLRIDVHYTADEYGSGSAAYVRVGGYLHPYYLSINKEREFKTYDFFIPAGGGGYISVVALSNFEGSFDNISLCEIVPEEGLA